MKVGKAAEYKRQHAQILLKADIGPEGPDWGDSDISEAFDVSTRTVERVRQPLVCMDESSKQQIREVRTPIPAEPGQPERYDTEYGRNGVSNLFMFFEPLTGQRHVAVTDSRTALDYTQAWQLAQHGGNRIQPPQPPMP